MELSEVSDLVDWAETVLPELPPLPPRYVLTPAGDEEIIREKMEIIDSFHCRFDGIEYTLMYYDDHGILTSGPPPGPSSNSLMGVSWFFEVGPTLLEIPSDDISARGWHNIAREIYIELKTQEMNSGRKAED